MRVCAESCVQHRRHAVCVTAWPCPPTSVAIHAGSLGGGSLANEWRTAARVFRHRLFSDWATRHPPTRTEVVSPVHRSTSLSWGVAGPGVVLEARLGETCFHDRVLALDAVRWERRWVHPVADRCGHSTCLRSNRWRSLELPTKRLFRFLVPEYYRRDRPGVHG
jgi:hypothetical protein